MAFADTDDILLAPPSPDRHEGPLPLAPLAPALLLAFAAGFLFFAVGCRPAALPALVLDDKFNLSTAVSQSSSSCWGAPGSCSFMVPARSRAIQDAALDSACFDGDWVSQIFLYS